MSNDFWIIEWQDIGGDVNHEIKVVARSPEDAVERIRLILSGETVMVEEAIWSDGEYQSEVERQAFDMLFEGENPVTALREPKEEITQECDGGKIIITPYGAPHRQQK
jgi:hypothetical protein